MPDDLDDLKARRDEVSARIDELIPELIKGHAAGEPFTEKEEQALSEVQTAMSAFSTALADMITVRGEKERADAALEAARRAHRRALIRQIVWMFAVGFALMVIAILVAITP